MKKILALTLTGILAFAGLATAAACKKDDKAPAPPAPSAQDNVYFVPGTYTVNGEKKENSISSGAVKLSEEDCAEMYTENVYNCTLPAGENLPVPTSDRTDGDDNPYVFNGWWTIVNATVTYYDKVPSVTETTILYADWRTDLSQRKDPVAPDSTVEVEPDHYLSILHAGETEAVKVTLREQATNMMNAEDLGYGYPVEICVQGLELKPGDVITVYTTGLSDSEKAEVSPILDESNSRDIQLESSTEKENDTADYLTADKGSTRRNPTLTYSAEEAGTFNIYIKYFSKGTVMAVYMEPMA